MPAPPSTLVTDAEFILDYGVYAEGNTMSRVKGSGFCKALRTESELYRALLRDPRCPGSSRRLLASAVAYALSPVDLIPDWIPVLGILDDIIIVPLLVWLAMRRIPPELVSEYRTSGTLSGTEAE